jgi:hypothetical protein
LAKKHRVQQLGGVSEVSVKKEKSFFSGKINFSG